MAIKMQEISCPEYGQDCPPMLRLTVTGNGFLKQMVRNIAGFIAGVGKRKQTWESLAPIIAARRRDCLGTPTAPAQGLVLAGVHYGEKDEQYV